MHHNGSHNYRHFLMNSMIWCSLRLQRSIIIAPVLSSGSKVSIGLTSSHYMPSSSTSNTPGGTRSYHRFPWVRVHWRLLWTELIQHYLGLEPTDCHCDYLYSGSGCFTRYSSQFSSDPFRCWCLATIRAHVYLRRQRPEPPSKPVLDYHSSCRFE